MNTRVQLTSLGRHHGGRESLRHSAAVCHQVRQPQRKPSCSLRCAQTSARDTDGSFAQSQFCLPIHTSVLPKKFRQIKSEKKVNKLNKRATTLSGKKNGTVLMGKSSNSHTSVSSIHTSVFAKKVPHCRKKIGNLSQTAVANETSQLRKR